MIKKAIYSVAELSSERIKKFRIISNPGCYPTSIQLPLIPLLKKKLIKFNKLQLIQNLDIRVLEKIIKINSNLKIFIKLLMLIQLQIIDMLEIDQEFKKISNKINFSFNPHLIPSFRGILSSIYITKNKNSSINKIIATLKNF